MQFTEHNRCCTTRQAKVISTLLAQKAQRTGYAPIVNYVTIAIFLFTVYQVPTFVTFWHTRVGIQQWEDII